MRLKKGFERLRGVAAAGVMGLGALLGGGSVRATMVSTTLGSVFRTYDTRGTQSSKRNVVWRSIGNDLFGGSAVTTSGGVRLNGTGASPFFGIGDASNHSEFHVGTGTSNTVATDRTNAFDLALSLAVDGNMFVNPGGEVDLTGDTLTSGPVANIIPGLDATVQYWFVPDRAVVRALYTLTNKTGSAITANALVAGNFGSDANTTVEWSQNGDDKILDGNDKWFITADLVTEATPTITTTRYGDGAGVIPSTALTPGGGGSSNDYYGMRYRVTVPAYSTRRVMVFHELGFGITPNKNAAVDFESLTALNAAGLLTDLTVDQTEIVNYYNHVPAFDATPAISGSATVGETLSVANTATTDLDGNNVTLSYQWLRDNVAIGSATAATYVAQSGDAGSDLSVTVTADDGHGGTASVTTAAVTVSSGSSSGGGGALGWLSLFAGLLLFRRRT